MTQGISVLGGYAGLGAVDPDARDFVKFETILHGDLLGNDPPVVWPPPPQPAQYVENSMHIMTVENGDALTLIEGLTFTHSRFASWEENLGGGLLCNGGQPIIQSCRFVHNRAERGAGIGLHESDATIRDCVFHQNVATIGGALHIGSVYGVTIGPSDAVIEDSTFSQNVCVSAGGAVVVIGTAVVRRTSFVGNVARFAANGGAISTTMSPTVIEDCYFQDNSADNGGAIHGNPRIYRTVFHHNGANWAGAIYEDGNLELECYDCRFTDNRASYHGGAFMGTGTFVRCDFDNNSVFWDGGGAVLGAGSFVNCRFIRNRSNLYGGGAVYVGAQSRFINCYFASNSTTEEGGGAVRIHPRRRR